MPIVLNGSTGITANNLGVETIVDTAGTGKKVLGGTLDRIRITTVNGTDQFDAGTINVSWEF